MSKKTLCEKCHLRECCTELCETAQKYADMDRVKQTHRLTPTVFYNKNTNFFPTFSDVEKILHLYFVKGMKGYKIAELLCIPSSTTYYHIKKYKKILDKKHPKKLEIRP